MSCDLMHLAKNRWICMVLIVGSATLIGCGLTAEEQAATASAWRIHALARVELRVA